jgi:hypothetical protein
VEHLDAFSGSLTSLVLDNNELTSASLRLPPLPALTTLWVNNNKIADLDEFLAHVRAQCPAITYLSMLKNAACPNFFTGKPSEDYHRYRRHVLSVLPSLRFLDASPVTDAERGIAAAAAAAAASSSSSSSSLVGGAAGSSARASVAIGSSPSEAFLHGERESSSTIADDSAAEFHIAPEKGLDRMPARDQNDVHAAFGVSTYTYVGKASEGNRFISNNEL